jgi:ribonuclease G
VEIFINPYLKSYLTKGVFSQRWKWVTKYKLKITLVSDETVSLNEFKATLSGSDIDITDVVLRGDSIDDILNAPQPEIEDSDRNRRRRENLDYFSKEDQENNGNGNGRSNSDHRSRSPQSR